MKRILRTLLIIVVIFVLVLAGGAFWLQQGLSSGTQLAIGTVDLSKLADGTYAGKYNSGRFTNELRVTVKDHKITSVDVVKDVLIPNKEMSRQLFDEVIARQNTDVDVISGGTVTSKAYLKSIENALNK